MTTDQHGDGDSQSDTECDHLESDESYSPNQAQVKECQSLQRNAKSKANKRKYAGCTCTTYVLMRNDWN